VRPRFVIVVLGVLLSNAWPGREATEGKSKNWPEIRQITKSQYLPNVETSRFNIIIWAMNNQPLYRFHCMGQSALERVDPADSWAHLSCHLHSLYGRDPKESLLIEDPYDREAASRGEIWSKDLWGRCADYPDWGRIRDFMLRGMHVRIELSRIKFDDARETVVPHLRAVHLRVSVYPDPAAASSVARASPYDHPRGPEYGPLNCEVLVKRGERMEDTRF